MHTHGRSPLPERGGVDEIRAREKRVGNRVIGLRERTFELAHAFLADVRRDLEAAVAQRFDLPPRIRTMHTRAGHATPEYRTLAIPQPEGMRVSTDLLSRAIAQYASTKPTCGIVLAFDAVHEGEDGEPCPVMIAEARDRWGTRLFFMQPYHAIGGRLAWGEPTGGGWRDPGKDEMILDAAFEPSNDLLAIAHTPE
jgi:hypothetical protein